MYQFRTKLPTFRNRSKHLIRRRHLFSSVAITLLLPLPGAALAGPISFLSSLISFFTLSSSPAPDTNSLLIAEPRYVANYYEAVIPYLMDEGGINGILIGDTHYLDETVKLFTNTVKMMEQYDFITESTVWSEGYGYARDPGESARRETQLFFSHRQYVSTDPFLSSIITSNIVRHARSDQTRNLLNQMVRDISLTANMSLVISAGPWHSDFPLDLESMANYPGRFTGFYGAGHILIDAAHLYQNAALYGNIQTSMMAEYDNYTCYYRINEVLREVPYPIPNPFRNCLGGHENNFNFLSRLSARRNNDVIGVIRYPGSSVFNERGLARQHILGRFSALRVVTEDGDTFVLYSGSNDPFRQVLSIWGIREFTARMQNIYRPIGDEPYPF